MGLWSLASFISYSYKSIRLAINGYWKWLSILFTFGMCAVIYEHNVWHTWNDVSNIDYRIRNLLVGCLLKGRKWRMFVLSMVVPALILTGSRCTGLRCDAWTSARGLIAFVFSHLWDHKFIFSEAKWRVLQYSMRRWASRDLLLRRR